MKVRVKKKFQQPTAVLIVLKSTEKKIRQNKKSEREGHERCLIYKMKT